MNPLTPESVVRAIDYPLFREQKNTLTNLLMAHEGHPQTRRLSGDLVSAHLQGILNLLDDLHDAAITLDITPYMADPDVKERAVGKANHPES